MSDTVSKEWPYIANRVVETSHRCVADNRRKLHDDGVTSLLLKFVRRGMKVVRFLVHLRWGLGAAAAAAAAAGGGCSLNDLFRFDNGSGQFVLRDIVECWWKIRNVC